MSPTPIEDARNLGPKTGAELRAVGIGTLEKLRDIGWEAALERVIERFPERANLNMAAALIGAERDCDWREVSSNDKAYARKLLERLR
jgi:hypothetical protein